VPGKCKRSSIDLLDKGRIARDDSFEPESREGKSGGCRLVCRGAIRGSRQKAARRRWENPYSS